MVKRYDLLINLESILLIVAGFVHILYLLFFVDIVDTTTQLYGVALFFGITYLVLGIMIWRKLGLILQIALILNLIGLIGVIMNYEISPSRMIDPFLIMIDFISIPLLIYLIMNRYNI